MTRSIRATLCVMFLLGTAAACSDGAGPEEMFDLTISGDATFQGPHGGQAVSVALLASDGTVLDTSSGTVSATADPSFSFTFSDALSAGESYSVDYWVDSNFNGGTEGQCDAPPVDHQWRVAVGAVSANVTLTEDHAPAEITSVCASF